MTDRWLTLAASYGLWIAMFLSVLAALAGGIAGIAGKQLSDRATAKLQRQVGVTIGGEWEPLTAEQIGQIRERLLAFGKPDRIMISWTNEFGKAFARSVGLAFEAAHWTVEYPNTPGIWPSGISVGPGPTGVELQKIISQALNIQDVKALDPTKSFIVGTGCYFGVGAKAE